MERNKEQDLCDEQRDKEKSYANKETLQQI